MKLNSAFYLKLHSYLSAFSILFSLFVIEFLNKTYLEKSIGILSIIFPFLIIWNFNNLFLKSKAEKNPFSYRLINIKELEKESKLGEYIKLFFLMLAYKPHEKIGFFIFTIFSITLLSVFLIASFIIFIKKKKITAIVIGFLFFSFFFVLLGKQIFVRNYGTEIIGDFFEKPEYKTKYFVLVSPEKNTIKKYKLIANIHITTQISDGYPEIDNLGIEFIQTSKYKSISLEKIFCPNGGSIFFLKDAYLEMNREKYCIDNHNRGWYIKLIPEKPK